MLAGNLPALVVLLDSFSVITGDSLHSPFVIALAVGSFFLFYFPLCNQLFGRFYGHLRIGDAPRITTRAETFISPYRVMAMRAIIRAVAVKMRHRPECSEYIDRTKHGRTVRTG